MTISKLVNDILQSPLKMAAISATPAACLAYCNGGCFTENIIIGISTGIIVGFGAFNFKNPDYSLLGSSALFTVYFLLSTDRVSKNNNRLHFSKLTHATYCIASGISVSTIIYVCEKHKELARG